MGSSPAPPGTQTPARPRRLALGRSPRRLSFERRIRFFLWLLLLPCLALGAGLLKASNASASTGVILACALLAGWAIAISLLMEQIVRPLQTLANVIAALREDDFSFRARGGRRNDAVGDLAIEVNALAGTLQGRRTGAIEAMALLERVMSAMQSPVLAFAPDGTLRLINRAAERAFHLAAGSSIGKDATALHLDHLLSAADDELISLDAAQASTRWIVQKSSFRLLGIPHTLLVLSDVSAALREEERVAWQRLIRVIGHEINNSLTPIKSIAGSLRAQSPQRRQTEEGQHDLERGLAVIENRAESLNRFLQAYSQLAGLPAPRRTLIALEPLLERVCRVETRLAVGLEPGPPVSVLGDPDQLQQVLINLIKNGADAALSLVRESVTNRAPEVTVGWQHIGREVVISIRDTGTGIANGSNLFVPFYTTKAEGTGIGLVLSLQIVEAHGGALRLRNRVDMQGCEAEVRLPVISPA